MNRFLTTELIGKSSRLITNNLSQKLLSQNIEITTEQWIILQILSGGSKSQKELGDITLKNKASINSLVSNLLKLNFVNKTISPKDKRETVITITEIGDKTRKETLEVASESVNEILKDFSVSEVEQLNKFLNRINSNLINK